jgi:hypothetical protein
MTGESVDSQPWGDADASLLHLQGDYFLFRSPKMRIQPGPKSSRIAIGGAATSNHGPGAIARVR